MMLNQAAVEALCSAKYLENYLDCLENLPDDLQRSVSQLRELDSKTADFIRDIDHHKENYMKEGDSNQKKRALFQIQRLLVKCQEIGDEKLQLVAAVLEHIESRTRQLDSDRENLDPGSAITPNERLEEPKMVLIAPPPAPAPKPVKVTEEKAEKAGIKRQRRQRTAEAPPREEEKKPQVQQEDKDQPKKKKKKRKVKKQEKEGDKSPLEPIDPDEPVYCLCQQVSYGEMIGCDNDSCQIEWFHFNCVGLVNKPKGKWYCPNCRGDKSNIPKKC